MNSWLLRNVGKNGIPEGFKLLRAVREYMNCDDEALLDLLKTGVVKTWGLTQEGKLFPFATDF